MSDIAVLEFDAIIIGGGGVGPQHPKNHPSMPQI